MMLDTKTHQKWPLSVDDRSAVKKAKRSQMKQSRVISFVSEMPVSRFFNEYKMRMTDSERRGGAWIQFLFLVQKQVAAVIGNLKLMVVLYLM